MANSVDEDDVERGICGDVGGSRHPTHFRHRRFGLHGRARHLRTGRNPIRVSSARTKCGIRTSTSHSENSSLFIALLSHSLVSFTDVHA
jgi:hypothetical protein